MIVRLRQKLILVAVLLIAGCTQYQLVSEGDQIHMGDAFTLTPQRTWSRLDHGRIEQWTVNGPLLEEVIVYKGIEDGEDLLIPNPVGKKPDDFPTFQKTMTALEVRDLLEATFARAQEVDIRTFDMKPWKFADRNGFRFEYRYTTKSGLRKRGFTVGAIHEEKLFMIVFAAAELHYYDQFESELERLMSTIERRA